MRVDFYHLEKSSLEQVLPILVEKAYQAGKRLLIKTSLEERANFLEELLWTYKDDSWLPHGRDNAPEASEQPILISCAEGNLNQAQIVLLTEGGELQEIQSFERCLNLFDGRDEASVQSARELWKSVVQSGNEAYYWQQSQTGQWEMKASKK